MTNREWLESLTDKEFLKNCNSLIDGELIDDFCSERGGYLFCKNLSCKQCKLDWLQAEYKEDQ